MTKLEPGKKLTRETVTLHRGDPLVIELHPRHLAIRPKGRRGFLTLDYESLYDIAQHRAAKLQLAAEFRERAKSRKAGR